MEHRATGSHWGATLGPGGAVLSAAGKPGGGHWKKGNVLRGGTSSGYLLCFICLNIGMIFVHKTTNLFAFLLCLVQESVSILTLLKMCKEE